jgi:hypothetical protein
MKAKTRCSFNMQDFTIMTVFLPMATPLFLELFPHGRSRITDLVDDALQLLL